MKKLLTDLTKDELTQIAKEEGLPTYRARQLSEWLALGVDFDGMTNLPKPLRESLSDKYSALGVKIIKEAKSKDGTVKFLYELRDGNLIEGVLMSYKYGHTLCVSTQVGCRMGCAFCASGLDGLLRNLTAGEMLGEVISANAYLRKRGEKERVGNVVLMGSGEPLDNYEEVTKFLRLLGESQGIGQRSVSLSTCGLTEGVRRLADEGYSITLCVSLHAPTDEKRLTIMPTARKYKVREIIDSAKYYFEKSGRRVIYEYAMMRNLNISDSDADMLATLTKGYPSHVNLIPLNETGSSLVGVNRREAEEFLKKLTKRGVSATIRRSLGEDVEGACGQLRRKYTEKDNTEDK
ncbi:MAG: 23S rRNA (adenine(2503)-C(2))-methyltransferase RlmN [Clostridia bacterium]|nr:23S rRNA (adenine(2503)-C(2))-methyltransferase RlmN [Clostridia bacterium]